MKKLFILIIAVGLVMPNLVLADGVIIPPPDRYVYEAEQKAVIYYEDGLETMVLSIQFYGNAYDFGWIVPTPSYPQVDKSSVELFTSLEEFTEIDYPYEVPYPMYDNAFGTAERQKVEVLETKNVDYYEVTILRASEAGALAAWLQENNYDWPEGADYVLEDYIDNNWYFTCFKVNTSAWGYSKVSEELRSGNATPVQFQFATEQIVYPLKISGVMEQYDYIGKQKIYDYYYQPPETVSILLYVLADHRQTVPGYQTDYAGWVEKDTIEKFAYVDSQPWLIPQEDKYFLTRLFNVAKVTALKDDLIMRQADDDSLINAEPLQNNSQNGFWVVVIIGLVITAGLVSAIIVLQVKKIK